MEPPRTALRRTTAPDLASRALALTRQARLAVRWQAWRTPPAIPLLPQAAAFHHSRRAAMVLGTLPAWPRRSAKPDAKMGSTARGERAGANGLAGQGGR